MDQYNLDLFYCLIVYEIGLNNTFAWISQFLNMLKEIEIHISNISISRTRNTGTIFMKN